MCQFCHFTSVHKRRLSTEVFLNSSPFFTTSECNMRIVARLILGEAHSTAEALDTYLRPFSLHIIFEISYRITPNSTIKVYISGFYFENPGSASQLTVPICDDTYKAAICLYSRRRSTNFDCSLLRKCTL